MTQHWGIIDKSPILCADQTQLWDFSSLWLDFTKNVRNNLSLWCFFTSLWLKFTTVVKRNRILHSFVIQFHNRCDNFTFEIFWFFGSVLCVLLLLCSEKCFFFQIVCFWMNENIFLSRRVFKIIAQFASNWWEKQSNFVRSRSHHHCLFVCWTNRTLIIR